MRGSRQIKPTDLTVANRKEAVVLERDLLGSIATELMSGAASVRGKGKTLRVGRTSTQHLKTVRFTMNGREYQAIEQNPDKPSRWGRLARAGHQVVQFKDVRTNKFVAVALDGKVIEYGSRCKRGHPGAEQS